LASLCDVSYTAASSLDHLVMGPAPFVKITVAETNRDIVDQLGDLMALEISVPTVPRNQFLVV